MFLGLEDLPFKFVAMAPVTTIQITLSTWPPSSNLGFAPDNNLLFLRFCAREYWDYLQMLRRKSNAISSPPFRLKSVALPAASHHAPVSCRIGPDLLLDIAQQPKEAMRLLVSAVHVQVSPIFSSALFCYFTLSCSPQHRMYKLMVCVPFFLLSCSL